jgi:hypothetical protein
VATFVNYKYNTFIAQATVLTNKQVPNDVWGGCFLNLQLLTLFFEEGTTFSIMTLAIMTLSIQRNNNKSNMLLSIMKPSIMSEHCYAECH